MIHSNGFPRYRGSADAPTLVALHAHPDDEAIFTGGLLARAASRGWRCVVVVATSGEGGRLPRVSDDIASHRRGETHAAARILGVARVIFLGYGDSGMARDVPPPGALARADPAEVFARVQAVIDDERPELVVSYDRWGIYGHPDHLAVHRLGRELTFAGELYEATLCRTDLAALRLRWIRRGMPETAWPVGLADTIGMDHPDLIRLEVERHFARKQAAIAAHDSQVVEADSFMGLPPGVFHQLLATEWYYRVPGGDPAVAGLFGNDAPRDGQPAAAHHRAAVTA